MTFKKANPIIDPQENKMVEPVPIVEPQISIPTTVKKIIHKSVFDYYGADDFAKILLSDPVKTKIQEYFFGNNNRGREYLFFSTIFKFKWRKVVEESDKENIKDFWCCNLVFARNLFYKMFAKTFSNKPYTDQEGMCICPFTLLNPAKFSTNEAINFSKTLKELSPELNCWQPCGDNPKL